MTLASTSEGHMTYINASNAGTTNSPLSNLQATQWIRAAVNTVRNRDAYLQLGSWIPTQRISYILERVEKDKR